MRFFLFLITVLICSCNDSKNIEVVDSPPPNVDQAMVYVGMNRNTKDYLVITNNGDEAVSFNSSYAFEWRNADPEQISTVWHEVTAPGCGLHGHYTIEPDQALKLDNFTITPYLAGVNYDKIFYRIGILVAGVDDEGNPKLKVFWSNEFYHE